MSAMIAFDKSHLQENQRENSEVNGRIVLNCSQFILPT